MIKNIKNHTDYFLPEIPKWITHYGFAIMILLLIGFVSAASFIEYSDSQRFDIFITKGSQTAKLDFAVYNRIAKEQPVIVEGPFPKPVKGYLQKQIISAKDTYVMVPVVVPGVDLRNLPIDGQLKCHGSFKISKGSLLDNLVKAR